VEGRTGVTKVPIYAFRKGARSKKKKKEGRGEGNSERAAKEKNWRTNETLLQSKIAKGTDPRIEIKVLEGREILRQGGLYRRRCLLIVEESGRSGDSGGFSGKGFPEKKGELLWERFGKRGKRAKKGGRVAQIGTLPSTVFILGHSHSQQRPIGIRKGGEGGTSEGRSIGKVHTERKAQTALGHEAKRIS